MSTITSSKRAPGGPGGFTLIELMVVVVVVGIVAAIALPSFLDSIRKSRRSDGVAALAAVQQAQERWRANKATYANNDQLTLGPSANPPGLGLRDTSSKGYYAISIGAPTATGYTATATAAAGTSQAGDGTCQRLRVQVDRGNIIYSSAAAEGDFDESATNRCWAR
jgi:type IV pilus assembly protein PilE